MQENDVEGVGRECVVREWRVEKKRWQVSWINFFLNFYFLFSHKHKNYVYLFRFRGYDEEERKEVENKQVPCDTRVRQIFIKFWNLYITFLKGWNLEIIVEHEQLKSWQNILFWKGLP